MTRFIALLRAINVGGHNVKMDHLRELFESLAFSSVETFIASGNVIFESKSKDATALERKIEARLRDALGYEVTTFLRTAGELAAVANYAPFPAERIEAAAAYNVGFLAGPLDDDRRARLMALETDYDAIHVYEREVYWLCQMRQSESKLTNNAFEKALGMKATFRGINTVRRLTAKYPPG